MQLSTLEATLELNSSHERKSSVTDSWHMRKRKIECWLKRSGQDKKKLGFMGEKERNLVMGIVRLKKG